MQEQKKFNRLLDILNYATNLLTEEGIKNPRLNVEMMLTSVLKCDRIKLYLNFDMPLNQKEIIEFKSILKRRINHEPLQYILKKTSFYGYDISLNNSVLIPRQETEILVETFLNAIDKIDNRDIRILEIGTGSGCISIAVANELKKRNRDYHIKSIDISSEAIKVAENNKIAQNSENLEFEVKDMLDIKNFNDFDYIITNPPYISLAEYNKLDQEILKYEPEIALTDKSDGCTFYRHILKKLKATSSKCKIYFEIGNDIKENLELLLDSLKLSNCLFIKDYNGLYRILIVEN